MEKDKSWEGVRQGYESEVYVRGWGFTGFVRVSGLSHYIATESRIAQWIV